MVYLKHLFDPKTATSFLLAGLALGALIPEVESTKIVYKKSIDGKTNLIKMKPKKTKTIDYDEPAIIPTATATTTTTTTTATTTTTTTTTMPTPTTLRTTSTTTPSMHEHLEVAESAPVIQTIQHNELKEEHAKESNETQMPQQLEATSSIEIDTTIATIDSRDIEKDIEPILDLPENHIEIESVEQDEVIVAEHSPAKESFNEDPFDTKTTTTTTTDSIKAHTPTSNSRPVPCTCGVFMTSQVKRTKNPYEPPKGSPVITNELDRIFPCNAVGQKQCQTKCLEAIVQHLPNSANILCATLDRDIRKERAYLYIKNCRNQWFNTNLTAGREYCCKNGQPYQCPLI